MPLPLIAHSERYTRAIILSVITKQNVNSLLEREMDEEEEDEKEEEEERKEATTERNHYKNSPKIQIHEVYVGQGLCHFIPDNNRF